MNYLRRVRAPPRRVDGESDHGGIALGSGTAVIMALILLPAQRCAPAADTADRIRAALGIDRLAVVIVTISGAARFSTIGLLLA
jgi:hypothetical protein